MAASSDATGAASAVPMRDWSCGRQAGSWDRGPSRQLLLQLARRANALMSATPSAATRGTIHELLNDIAAATRSPFAIDERRLQGSGNAQRGERNAELEDWELRLAELLYRASFATPDIAAVAAVLADCPLRDTPEAPRRFDGDWEGG